MFAKSYIENVIQSEPTWLTCVDLLAIAPDPQLERVIGGLAAAIRSGSEITHEDRGQDWIDLSIECLRDMEPLKDMTSDARYSELDGWLVANENRIVCMIHRALSRKIDKAQQDATSNGG
jgi:hypothetical protein